MKTYIKYCLNWQIQHPKTVVTLLFLITIILSRFATSVKFDFTIEHLFARNDPEVDAYFDFREDFGREDATIFLVYECDDPFSFENLKRVEDLTSQFEEIEGIEEVTSITNVELFEESEDLILSSVFQTIPSDKDSIEFLKQRIVQNPLLINNLISVDEQKASIVLEILDDYNTHEERERIIREIDEIQTMTDWEWHEAGIPVLRTRYVQYMLDDFIRFLVPIIGVLILVLFFLFKNVRGVLLPIIPVLITDTWALGLMYLFDININIVTYLVPSLILIVGVADSIHILVKYHEELIHTEEKQKAVFETVKKVGAAIFLTSLTTAVGFFSLMSTNIVIVRQFGFMVGLSVMLAFVASITFVPSMLIILKKPSPKILDRFHKSVRHRFVTWVIRMNNRYKVPIIISSAFVVIVCFVFASRVDPHASLLEDFRKGNELYDDMHYMDREMGSVLPFEVVVKVADNGVPRIDGIKEPEVLGQIDNLQKMVSSIPEIGKTISIVDYIREMHKAWNEGDPDYYTIPETKQQVSQLLLGHEENLESLVDIFDYDKARISARIHDVTSKRASEISNEIFAWCKDNLSPNLQVQLTGTTLMALRTNQYLVKNLVTSFIIAFGVIFISMLVLFRSLKLASLSMIPNIIPLLLLAGIMGAFHIKLRPTTAMTFAIAFGIAVDDTIHYLARFRQELFASHGKYRVANEQTLLTTGKAIISTSIILIAGFLVLISSNFIPSKQFGFLAASTLLGALIGDLFFLPSVIGLVRPRIPFLRHSYSEDKE